MSLSVFEHFLSVGNLKQVVFQAKTQAEVFLLNWAPARLLLFQLQSNTSSEFVRHNNKDGTAGAAVGVGAAAAC